MPESPDAPPSEQARRVWGLRPLIGATGDRFDWGDVALVYRNLAYSTSGDEIIEDLRMAGPALGATFRW